MRAPRRGVKRPKGGNARIPLSAVALARNLEEQQLQLELQNQSLLESQHELEISRERYSEFFDAAPACFVGLNSAGVIAHLNLTAAKFLDRPRRHLIGIPFQMLLGNSSRRLFRAHIGRCRRSDGSAGPFSVELELANTGISTGTRRYIEVTSSVSPMYREGVTVFNSIFFDITERRRLQETRETHERELTAARDESERANKAKDDFLAALSHELRTPLNPALLVSSEAAKDSRLSASVRAQFELVRRSIELEARLIDDMLDLTRITHGKLALNTRPLHLHASLRQALATIRTEIEFKRIRVEECLGAARDLILGDAVRLQQVFWNVLKNAVKFTPAGGSLWASSALDGDKAIVISIKDTGIGMTEGELASVFEAFSQGEHARQAGPHRFGGLGLGLAISRRLVEGHGGSIAATSPGREKGSTIDIRLPLAPASIREPANDEPSKPAHGAAGHFRILVVEDHEPTRAALAKLLRRRGYDVRVSACAKEAREMAAAETFNLVITDIGLPDGNGYDLFAEVRKKTPMKGIALTGFGMDSDRARSKAAGFEAHLTKPITFQTIERTLAAVTAAAGTVK
ncbi:MAG TPA: ATP-binding protein [Opitutaceae bacterium]|jgi:PAS domain S-box-containing protein